VVRSWSVVSPRSHGALVIGDGSARTGPRPPRQRIYALAKAIVRALQPGNGRSHRCESGGRTALKAVQGLSAKQRQIMDLGDEGVKRPKPDEGSDNDTDAKG
jgi:hypothetical protein